MYRGWTQTDYQNKHYNIIQKWLQHVQRMDTDRLPKQALQYKPKGRRNIGRPRTRWRDQLHLEDHGTGNTPNPSRTWCWWWWYSNMFAVGSSTIVRSSPLYRLKHCIIEKSLSHCARAVGSASRYLSAQNMVGRDALYGWSWRVPQEFYCNSAMSGFRWWWWWLSPIHVGI